jgi:membrane fusion protein (multidrug efflux system)
MSDTIPSSDVPEGSTAAASVARGWSASAKGATGVAIALLVAAIASGWSTTGEMVDTDDAYVQGNLIQITPQIAGTVISIGADDTDFVRAGQALVQLDPTDGRVALVQAKAQLAQIVREVRTLFAGNATLRSQVALRDAEVSRVTTELGRLQDDVDRRKGLVESGAIGREEFDHSLSQLKDARDALLSARSASQAARDQLSANESLTDGTTLDGHPNVLRAAAHLRETWIALKRSELPAPANGYVARRGVQLGQRVQPGTPLMTVVPLDSLWVDANFKEDQLRRLRIGQRVHLVADVYGSDIEYHGKVAGLGSGTGSAFALLPAQNATGNWVKIVQRVPVRITLDAGEVAKNPLRIGLSMSVGVDTSDLSGKALSDAPPQGPRLNTTVFDDIDGDVDATVSEIIASNAGSRTRSPATRTPSAAR